MIEIRRERKLAEIRQEIERYVAKHGHRYRDYYIGITTSPEERFAEHKINISDSDGLYFVAESEEDARNIEKEFTTCAEEGKKMQGSDGGGTGDPNDTYFVYCYLITDETKQ